MQHFGVSVPRHHFGRVTFSQIASLYGSLSEPSGSSSVQTLAFAMEPHLHSRPFAAAFATPCVPLRNRSFAGARSLQDLTVARPVNFVGFTCRAHVSKLVVTYILLTGRSPLFLTDTAKRDSHGQRPLQPNRRSHCSRRSRPLPGASRCTTASSRASAEGNATCCHSGEALQGGSAESRTEGRVLEAADQGHRRKSLPRKDSPLYQLRHRRSQATRRSARRV